MTLVGGAAPAGDPGLRGGWPDAGDTMLAVVHGGEAGLGGIRIAEVPRPAPGPGEALVRVAHAGLNRHELFTALRRDAESPTQILGADASGVVVALGAGTTGVALGDPVIVDPTLHWPFRKPVPAHPLILGGTVPGTFAEFIAIPVANLHTPPAHLAGPERGALGLAAVTAYRALFTVGGLRAGEHLLVPGIGSGVGLLALDLAVAAGAEVTVTSRSARKREFALARGAARALVTGEVGASGLRSVDLVVDTVGAASVADALPALRPGGRLVTLGATTGAEIELSLRELFFRQLSISGTSVGSAEEFREMLAMVAEHRIRPVIESVHPLIDAPAAMRESERGGGQGKIIFAVEKGDPA